MVQKLITPFGEAEIYRKTTGNDRHILIVPGYSESITHTKELVDNVAKQGKYDVITFSQPRKDATTHPLDRQRDIILSVLSSCLPKPQRVHAVAHSLGSAALLRAAKKSPERFASLLLMQPSGIVGSQSFLKLAYHVGVKTTKNHTRLIRDGRLRRSGEKRPHQVTLRQLMRTHVAGAGTIAKNPKLALKEAHVARQHSIAGDIKAVKDLGIPVSVIKAPDDELFKISRLKPEQIMELAGAYSSVLDKNAGHDTFWIHPEQTAQLIDAFIKYKN